MFDLIVVFLSSVMGYSSWSILIRLIAFFKAPDEGIDIEYLNWIFSISFGLLLGHLLV